MVMASNNFMTSFKRSQVRYRRQSADPYRIDDLNEFVDFSFPEEDDRIHLIHEEDFLTEKLGGEIYGLGDYPGFLYVPQALSPVVQLALAYHAVSKYCETPHATNIDLQPPKKNEVIAADGSMWDLWKREYDKNKSSTKKQRKYYRRLEKLSWSTCGYQYDWTCRAYHEEAKSPMPCILNELAIHYAERSLKLTEGAKNSNFNPTACIINYYNEKSTMGGHRDDLEWAIDKPVVSVSIGLPGLFLLGGCTKDDAVIPILVRPGDVMILGGKSRMNYHGMARVIPGKVQLPKVPQSSNYANWKFSTEVPESDVKYIKEYLRYHRVNINIRQVLPDGMNSISELSK